MIVLWIVLGVYIVNVIFSFIQLKKFNTHIVELKKNNKDKYISIGRDKRIIRKGSVAILIINREGIIEYGEIIKGRTVFSKIEKINGINSLMVDEVKLKYPEEKSIQQAISFYLDFIDRRVK